MNLIHHIIDIKQSQGMSGVSEYKGQTAIGTLKDGEMNGWKEDEWTDKDRNRSVWKIPICHTNQSVSLPHEKKNKILFKIHIYRFNFYFNGGIPIKTSTKYQPQSKQTHIKCHYTHTKIPQIPRILFCFIYAKYVQFHNRRQITDGERLTQVTKNRLILNIIGMLPRFWIYFYNSHTGKIWRNKCVYWILHTTGLVSMFIKYYKL